MTNTSSPPLEIQHDQIDPVVLEAIRKIDEIARRHETAYFLAGATAREIMLRHVFGRPPGRRTLDVDLGIAVPDWDHFKLLKTALVEQAGLQPHARMVQRITYPSKPTVVVDLIPFGGVETAERTIAWPPEEDIVMRVTGFSVSADTQKRLREILESDALMEELTNQIIVSSGLNDPEHVRSCEALVSKMREGFLQAR